MSDLTLRKPFPDEFSEELKTSVQKFIDEGLPNLSLYVSEQNKIKKLVALYLQGYSVNEIANNFNWPTEVVGFLVYKHNLYDLKQKTIEELNKTVADKIKIFKLKHIDFLIKSADAITTFYQNKLDDLHNKNAPNRPKDLNDIETEWLKLYFKIAESIEKIAMGQDDKNSGAATAIAAQINLQLPENSKIKKELDGSVSIINLSHKEMQDKINEIMSYMADLKRNNTQAASFNQIPPNNSSLNKNNKGDNEY